VTRSESFLCRKNISEESECPPPENARAAKEKAQKKDCSELLSR